MINKKILFFILIFLFLPYPVYAEYGYSPTAVTITQGTEITHYTYARASDNNYFKVYSTSSGIDLTLTISDVDLGDANVIYVNYDGSVSSASLTYEIQIKDFQNDTWRNVIPHGSTLANTTNGGVGLMTTLTSYVNNGTMFPIYNGYFSDGSNTPLNLPLSYFVNGSDQMQIRFLYSGTTPNLELNIDYLSVEPAIDNARYASSMTIASNYGTVSSGEYNDTTSDDNNTNLQITAGSSGLDAYFSFTEMPAPYTQSNTILVEYSGFRTTMTNYIISIYDFQNSEWDQLSATALTNTSDAVNYFATSTSQAVTDYFSSGASGGEVRISISSASTSGSATVDYIRITLGSVTTNTGFYVGTISRGGSPTGTVDNTKDLDTSTTASSWAIPTSTSDASATTQFPLDCGTATNSCVAANIQIPITLPTNTMVTGVHTAFRYSISSASVDLDFGIRSKRYGNVTQTDGTADATSLDMMLRTANYPMPPQVGLNPVGTSPVYQNDEYINTADNAVNLYVRTAATSVATAQTLTWDFAFASIRYLTSRKSITAAWTPTDATLTYGTNSSSNYRFANADDNYYFTATRDGTNGTDISLSFTNISIPTNANKIILTTNIRWSVAATAFEYYLWDFSGSGQWREITPHETNFASDATANREEPLQLEIFNGYFTDGSNTKVDTPVSTFVSSGEARLRIVSTSTTSNIGLDYALMEFVKDPVYFPSDMSIVNGTVTAGTEYNDTITDDATSNLVVSYSGGLSFDFIFDNVLTPPSGSNAIYLSYSGYRTTITNYSLSIRNFGGGSCSGGYEAFNATALTNTADALNYFIKSVSDWSCYISGGQMELRVTTTGGSGSLNVDYVKLALGSVNTASETSSIRFGETYYNTVAQARDLDTSQTYDANSQTWRIRSFPNSQSVRNLDSVSSVAGRIDLPLIKPANSYPIAIIWMLRGAISSEALTTITPSFEDRKNYYNDATNSQASLLGLAALPNAVNSIIIGGSGATKAQILREGWYVLNTPNTIDTVTNALSLRYRVTAGTNFSTIVFDIDAAFIALRYVE